MAIYQVSTPLMSYKIVTSRVEKTHYTLYEIYAGEAKIGGYLDKPDGETCDACYSAYLQRRQR